jgi:RNA polymerase sigma-70 factor (ECF subfamily)
LNELELISGLKRGDEAAFRRLVEVHGDSLYRLVMGILQDPEDAEDALQEVFIRVHASIGSFRGDARLSTWLYRIAVHKALEKARSKRIRVGLRRWLPSWMPVEGDRGASGWMDPGIRMEDRDKARALMDAIATLPDRQRVAFTLIHVEGMSYENVCPIMGLGLKAVESLISRAKVNLRKRLAAHRT